jgi:hypothetical protein
MDRCLNAVVEEQRMRMRIPVGPNVNAVAPPGGTRSAVVHYGKDRFADHAKPVCRIGESPEKSQTALNMKVETPPT